MREFRIAFSSRCAGPQIEKPLQNSALRSPQGAGQRADEANLNCLIFNLKMASLQF